MVRDASATFSPARVSTRASEALNPAPGADDQSAS